MSEAFVDIRGLTVTFTGGRKPVRAVGGVGPAGAARRGGGADRRIGLGQERHAAFAAAAAPAAAHADGWTAARGRAGRAEDEHVAAGRLPRQGHLDDLPGAAAGAGPGVHRGRADRREHPPARERQRRRGAQARAGAVRTRAHPQPRAAAGRLPARDERRHAPARDDRAGAGLQAAAAAGRRADHRAGCHGADPDPAAAARAAARDGAVGDLRHPTSAPRWKWPTASR